ALEAEDDLAALQIVADMPAEDAAGLGSPVGLTAKATCTDDKAVWIVEFAVVDGHAALHADIPAGPGNHRRRRRRRLHRQIGGLRRATQGNDGCSRKENRFHLTPRGNKMTRPPTATYRD